MKGLTEKQKQVYLFIQDYINMHQHSPSYREILEHFGWRSLGSVYKYTRSLNKKGYVEMEEKSARSLKPIAKDFFPKGKEEETEVPFIGHIRAGATLEIFSSPKMIAIPSSFIQDPERTYVLKAGNQSLLEEQIAEGDLLIVEARTEVRNGEMVIVVINKKNTLIKKFFLEEEYIRLENSFSDHQPIILHQQDVVIQGILIGLLRRYA